MIETVKGYLNNEKTRDDVEHDLTHLEGSVSENTWILQLYHVALPLTVMTMVC